jgi:hypothetical protein
MVKELNEAKRLILAAADEAVIESMQKTGRPFVVVSFLDFKPFAQENNIPFLPTNLTNGVTAQIP